MAKRYEIILRDLSKRVAHKILGLFEKEYLRDMSIRVMLGIVGVVALAVWLVALFRFQPSDFMVPIRYNSFLGVTKLGNWYDLYFIPGIMTFFILINTLLGSVVYKKDKMVGYILVAASIFVSALALLVVINFSILVNV